MVESTSSRRRVISYIRSSGTAFKNLEMYEDATIEDFNKPEEYGLGRLLKNAGKVPVARPSAKVVTMATKRSK